MKGLRRNLEWQLNIMRSSLPDYVVANFYFSPTQYIGEHTDDHTLFQTQERPAVILSCNVRRDTWCRLFPNSG
eukprot:12898391-Prorocentrum_lima.AAC.1